GRSSAYERGSVTVPTLYVRPSLSTASANVDFISSDTSGRSSGTAKRNRVCSCRSNPRACHTFTHVATLSARNPTVSSEGAKGSTPSVGSTPNDGLNPTMPQNEAGRITEPIV